MNRERLEQLLQKIAEVKLIVMGDYFLDYYLIIDRSLSEISLETGLEAYQVIETRKSPGAAGTVVSNLRALGASVQAIGLVGDDGNGYDLLKRLKEMQVNCDGLIEVAGYSTPTYMKPMIREADGSEHEINRMDIKSRKETPDSLQSAIIEMMNKYLPQVDGMLVVDQVQERNCGVITDRVRKALKEIAERYPHKVIGVDSREYLSLFEGVMLKSNVREAGKAAAVDCSAEKDILKAAERCGHALTKKTGRAVVITLSEHGLFVIENEKTAGVHLPAIKVEGPIDVVGAGDSVSAAIGAALCAGATLTEAAALGNLSASIVIKQLGTTGTASPQQILAQFDAHPEVPYFEK